MLIEPASKVSVPLTVVMRTRSRVPERDLNPAIVVVNVVPVSEYVTPDTTQLFDEIFVKTILPIKLLAACPEKIPNPVVYEAVATTAAIFELPDAYNVVDTDPEPI
jgi:hypothetical protein